MQAIIIYVLGVDIFTPPSVKPICVGFGEKSFVCKCKTFEGLASGDG
jgi:hypothetical protein